MEIIINHLTRMTAGYFCVAGLTRAGNRHVRPVTGRRLPRSFLDRDGGVFGLASTIEIGPTTPSPSPPEMEDETFNPADARLVANLSEEEFWAANDAASKGTLAELFGPALHHHTTATSSAVVDPGSGQASLGVLVPQGAVSIALSYGKVRCRFEDEALGQLDLSVTDVRVFREDWEPDQEAVARVSKLLLESEVLLSVGLTRAMGTPPFHWLQVNNIHLKKRS